MSHGGVPDARYDNKSALLKFETCLCWRKKWNMIIWKPKYFPFCFFYDWALQFPQWLSRPYKSTCFFKMTIFLQYIKRLLDLYTPNSQIILNTTLENNPLSHKLPFFKPQSFWHVYSQRCYFHLFIYWQKCPQLVRGIKKIDMVWEKESMQFIYIIFFLLTKKM